jgi:AcrR family transcriptional regulator
MNQPDASAGEPRAGRNSRLSAEDWAQAALDLIAEQGVGAVAVEPLARRLGVTKGSFYWHFPSRDALLQAALERWELFEQEQVFGSLEDVPDPRVRLRQLFQMVAHEVQPHIIYSELLKALDHPMVRPVIDRVSQRRLDYLVASFRQAGPQLDRCAASRTPGLCRLRRLPAVVAAAAAAQAGARGFRSVRRASDRDADSERMSARE